MRGLRLAALAALAVASLSCGARRARPGQPPPPAPVPDGETWVAHLRDELAPFWTSPQALGSPVGAFPTFRCDDGSLLDPQLPCSELTLPGRWVWGYVGREYARMRSRQTYFYGVAYHLTGDERFLEWARAGVTWLREHAFDPETGSAVSWWEGGVGGPAVLERTSQDLAYANLGVAFYAYLTRDPEAIADAVRLKEHVFREYDDAAFGTFRWVRKGPAGQAGRKELVAPLDQMNAYLLLLAPVVPEPHATAFRDDLRRLARHLVERYWSEELGLFRGTVHDPVEPPLGSRHTDFGHTIKALWMIERAGALTGDEALSRFAREKAPAVLARAYNPAVGCWASGVRRDGSLDAGLTWWISAELDQMAATLALTDPAPTGYLARTYACWRERFVDQEHGEVFAFVDPDDPSRRIGKAHLWKSGYHSAEHALVAYLTSQEVKRRPATLHFAFRTVPPREELRPYFFSGELVSLADEGTTGDGLTRSVATFRGIR